MVNESSPNLGQKSCQPCEGGVVPLSEQEIGRLLAQLGGWIYSAGEIRKTYRFKDYYQTLAFVNASAWVGHREDHHPDLEVGFNQCKVRFSTHAINGLSENDFICAAKIDALFEI